MTTLSERNEIAAFVLEEVADCLNGFGPDTKDTREDLRKRAQSLRQSPPPVPASCDHEWISNTSTGPSWCAKCGKNWRRDSAPPGEVGLMARGRYDDAASAPSGREAGPVPPVPAEGKVELYRRVVRASIRAVEYERDTAAEAVLAAARKVSLNSCRIIREADGDLQTILDPGEVGRFSRVCADSLHELHEALSSFDSSRGVNNG
jgi:hypothetical protein